MDFLTDTQAKIDCAKHTVTFFDDLVGINILEDYRNVSNMVCLVQRCRLPPQSEYCNSLQEGQTTYSETEGYGNARTHTNQTKPKIPYRSSTDAKQTRPTYYQTYQPH